MIGKEKDHRLLSRKFVLITFIFLTECLKMANFFQRFLLRNFKSIQKSRLNSIISFHVPIFQLQQLTYSHLVTFILPSTYPTLYYFE